MCLLIYINYAKHGITLIILPWLFWKVKIVRNLVECVIKIIISFRSTIFPDTLDFLDGVNVAEMVLSLQSEKSPSLISAIFDIYFLPRPPCVPSAESPRDVHRAKKPLRIYSITAWALLIRWIVSTICYQMEPTSNYDWPLHSWCPYCPPLAGKGGKFTIAWWLWWKQMCVKRNWKGWIQTFCSSAKTTSSLSFYFCSLSSFWKGNEKVGGEMCCLSVNQMKGRGI